MSLLGYFVAAVFLPLFPFSMAFNRLFAHLGAAWPRIGLLLLWPQLGLLALQAIGERPPAWLVWWALLTALLYALRSAALRDLGLWTGYLATSAWALLWAAAAFAPAGSNGPAPALQAAGLSLPLMLLSWLVGRLETTFGAAYGGLPCGLAASLPRLSGLLTLCLLAAVATPLVPGFFILLSTTFNALRAMPGAAPAILAVWLLWTWSGARMLRGLIAGPADAEPRRDLSNTATGLLGLALLGLLLAGISLSGEPL